MKKILHIIESFAVGGAETLLVSEIKELNMFENHVIALNKPDTLIGQLPANCKKTILNHRSYRDIFSTATKIKRYIRENKIDLVHSHLYWSNITARMGCPPDIKLINTIHAISSEASYKLNRITAYLEKWTYKKRHYIVGVSGEVLKDFDKWIGLKGESSVIYNMIDDVFFSKQPKTDFNKGQLKLVAVGNLRTQKNYKYMLKAFRDLPKEITLDVYGEGLMRNELQQEIDEYKLNVTLKGLSANMQNVLPQYDAFVMTSFYEGMPLSLMEAMALGLPVFVSDIPVLKEAGKTAATYFGIDDPQNLSNMLKNMLAGKYDLSKMSVNSMQTAKEMAGREKFISQIINLYNSQLH